MLRNSWSANVHAALLIGFFCTPTMAQTPVIKFLELVKSGWRVEIGTRTREGQIETMRIAERANTNKYIDVTANNGVVEDSEVWKTLEYLSGVERYPSSDRRAELGLSGTEFDATRPGPLPEGLRLRSETDGSSTITDNRGSAVGRIEKGASVARKEEVVVDALANRVAEGLISSPSNALPVSSAVMKETAKMIAADVDALVSESGAYQLLGGNASDSEIAQVKVAQTYFRLSSLEGAVSDALVDKGVKADKRMLATDLKTICDKNQLTLQFVASRDPNKIDSYRIVDPNSENQLVAAGTLTKSFWRGDKLFLKTEDLRALKVQIQDKMVFRNAVENEISEDLRWELDASDSEIKKFVETESKADPNSDPDNKDPNSTEGGKAKPGEGPSGPP